MEQYWFRILETHSYDMTKYCMKCAHPAALWYEGDCRWCKFEKEQEKKEKGIKKICPKCNKERGVLFNFDDGEICVFCLKKIPYQERERKWKKKKKK